jgi:hypothetical protein
MTSSCHAQLASGNWRAPRGQIQGPVVIALSYSGVILLALGQNHTGKEKKYD